MALVPAQALIFIGDAMEESIEELAALAGKLGALHTPIYLFQEGRDPAVRKAFRLLALKSGGAHRACELVRNQPPPTFTLTLLSALAMSGPARQPAQAKGWPHLRYPSANKHHTGRG